MPEAIVMRHRPTQFGHLFTGDHYAAGYYSYLWSEVLDADGFAAFKEAGDIFRSGDGEAAQGIRLLGRVSPRAAEAYKKFRGRMPELDALMKKRGLVEPPAADT